MKHARADYDHIQSCMVARELAEHVLAMQMGTAMGQRARQLARQVLSVADHGELSGTITVNTNGTYRTIPADEPVFLIRGQDLVGAAAVRAWADLAEAAGSPPDILAMARGHAEKMDAWPKKKVADAAPAPTPTTGA